MTENQTLFNEERPLSQDIYIPPEEIVVEAKPTFIKTRKGKLLIAGVAVVGVLSILLLLLLPRNRVAPTVEPTPSPSSAPITGSAMQQRIDDLEAELQAADPADAILPFPAVDMELELEPEERR